MVDLAAGSGSVVLYMKIGSKGSLTKESSKKPWADKGYTDIESFTIGASASWDFSMGKSASGSAGFSGLTVSRALVGSSPILFIACLKEKKTDLVEVIATDDSGTKELFVIRLKGEVRLTGSDISAGRGGEIQENLSFSGKVLEIEHKGAKKKDDIDWSDIKQKGADIS